MKKLMLLCSLLLCNLSFVFSQKPPAHINFGIYVKNIMLEERAKEKSNRFLIDGYWWMRYEMPQDTGQMTEYENIEFVNAEIHEKEVYLRYIYVDSITKKKWVYIDGHFNGDFVFFPSYRHYPMDKLILPISIESKNLVSEEFQLDPDTLAYKKESKVAPGVAKDIEIPSFNIVKSRFVKKEKLYETTFGDPRFTNYQSFSRLSYEIVIARRSFTFLAKLLIPVLLITLMAYLVFFVPVSKLEVAVGLTVTSLLSCIAVQLALGADEPVTGYIIASDKIFYLSYFVITFSMIQTVYASNLMKSGKHERARKYETLAKWLYPIIFITGVTIIVANGLLSHV
jgi:hypothetical protein